MKCCRSGIPVLVITLALGAAAGARAAGGADLTRAYLDAYAGNCAFGAAQVAALRRHQVLLVPGYFSNLDPNYYVDQLRWLHQLGVAHEKVAVKPGQSIAVNAAIIAEAIGAAAKPVLLLTHSKGSVDALEALRTVPALRRKVSGWVSLQGAFGGSPVADWLLDGTVLDPIVSTLILGFFGGSRQAAEGLTTAASRAYVRMHAGAISEIIRQVPILAFASALEPHSKTLLALPRDLMAHEGLQSDGLIPLAAAVLPGMDFVKVTAIDHIAPVMPALQPLDRVRMTQALLVALRGPLRGLPRDANCSARGAHSVPPAGSTGPR